jgi:hypothetical protein
MKSLALVFTVVVGLPSIVFPQDNLQARRDAYALCETNLHKDPELAYKSCKEYLGKYPDDDYGRVQMAFKWVTACEKVLAYTKAVQTLSSASSSRDWLVFEPDLNINLPQVSEKDGNYKIEIARLFNDTHEAGMLAKAEAVYGNQDKFIGMVVKDPVSWAEDLPEPAAPVWGTRGNDNVLVTEVITASAVCYYYDLSISAREHRKFRSVFQMISTGLKYTASIVHYAKYEHSGKKFDDVYVADLNLEWSSICGGLCGIGFTRNKLVALDHNGDVLALFLDAQENRQMWES